MPTILPIELLHEGQQACVVDIDGSRETVLRLQEMGLSPGTSVRVVRRGNPCILAVGERRLSFRGQESASIFVEIP